MTDELPDLTKTDGPLPATAHAMSVIGATIFTIVAAVVTVAGILTVLRNSWGTAIRGVASVVTLVAVLALSYALVQLVLAVIASAGERRWFSRQVSERRQGERARKPR
jgi:membrane-anchored glycerophosphoryl diester phosphodiesterase (GDPDase)